MLSMRIALAQINPTVGDSAGNTDKHLSFIDRAAEQGAELVVFPELSVIGYPPKDLLLKPAVIERCEQAVQRIAERCTDIAALVGYPTRNRKAEGRPLHNAVAVCAGGKVVDRRLKSLLPTYDVFDEHRYFEPGKATDISKVGETTIGISVCEDLWGAAEHFNRKLYHDNPIDKLAEAGADLFINCSASPFIVGKHAKRLDIIADLALEHGLPIVFVNQVGGNDELIFDGNSCVVAADGTLLAHAASFEEDLVVVDLRPTTPNPKSETRAAQRSAASQSRARNPKSEIASVWGALKLGLGDYCRKCGFKTAVLGLSGGIDSAVTACVAAAALGAENVTGIGMPSRFSSEGSKSDAQRLAENLGMTYHEIPIETAHKAMEQTLEPYFAGTTPGIAEENVQARLRGLILMSFSNKFGSILLTTGNKSEMAVGYCTLYGDMAGGLAVLSDVPKTLVYELARWINTPDCELTAPGSSAAPGSPAIPVDTITKPPSAELRPDQKDTDSLPEYDVLDEIIDRYVEREQSARTIISETGFDEAMVLRFVKLIDRNEYKRKQTPPGLKITGRAFGFGRRMPIAQRYDPS